jgi:two-component system, NtrC family, response regulator HydG
MDMKGPIVPRVLLVEDDVDVRPAVEAILLDEGYDVDAAQNCRQGQAFLDKQTYDLLLTDGRLPDGTGVDLANAAGRRRIPAIIMTGYAFVLCAAPNLRHKVLLKPARPAEIMDAIAEVLHRVIHQPANVRYEPQIVRSS